MVMIIGLMITGCESGSGNGTSIFTIEFKTDNEGFIQLATNDPVNCGYALFGIESEEPANPNVYELDCKKISGYEEEGYGMLFEASPNNDDKFYAVVITADGYYSIFKSTGSEFEDETPITEDPEWKTSSAINKGYNQLNNIKVVKAESMYTVYLNGTQVEQFTDTDDFGNNIGVYVAVGDEAGEAFPEIPVDVRFKLK
jgi:hypothetical protein